MSRKDYSSTVGLIHTHKKEDIVKDGQNDSHDDDEMIKNCADHEEDYFDSVARAA